MKKIIIIQPIIKEKLGIPRFTGKKMVLMVQRFKLPAWRIVEFVNGEAILPRGYKAVTAESGEVEMRDL